MSAAEPLPDFEIRPMAPSDIDAVVRIENATFTVPWSRRTFMSLVHRSDVDLLVATVDGVVRGYAVAWYAGGEGELGDLAVDEGWRGRGLGGRLLDTILARARERRARRIFLEVRISNRPAQAFYERRGFETVGVRRRYYRRPVEDAKLMSLNLSRADENAPEASR